MSCSPKSKVDFKPRFLARAPIGGNQDSPDPIKAELFLYDEISDGPWYGISSEMVRESLDQINADEIDVHINSPGGEVDAGIAIYNLLKNSPAKINIHIDGIAASIASIISMAGDTITIAENGRMMIHNAWTIAAGDKHGMAKIQERLSKADTILVGTYASRTGLDAELIAEMMEEETWLLSDEAMEYGFVTAINENKKADAAKSPENFQYKNVSEDTKSLLSDEAPEIPEDEGNQFSVIALQKAQYRQRKRQRKNNS